MNNAPQSAAETPELLDCLPDALVCLDAGFRYTYVNRAASQLLGAPREALLGQLLWDVFPALLGTSVEDHYRRAMADRVTTVFENFFEPWRKWYAISVAPGPGGGLVIRFADITERHQAQEVQAFLARAGADTPGEPFFETLARYLASTLQMDFVCIDRLVGDNLLAHTEAVWFDGTFLDNFTYALKDTPCGTVLDRRVCCFPATVRNLFPLDPFLQDMQAESYAGTTLWSTQGKPIGLIAVIGRRSAAALPEAEALLELVSVRAARELERKLAEEALRESEAQLREAARLARLGGWKLDISTRRFVATEEVFQLLEADSGTLETVEAALAFYTPECRPGIHNAILRAIEFGEPFSEELEVITSTKRRLPVRTVGRVRTLSDGTRIVDGTIQDISEARRAEQDRHQLSLQVARAQKMESIGRLAGGVAHDFNNLLTVINGYAALALQQTLPGDPRSQGLAEICRAGDRAAGLVRQLLAFSRKQTLQPVLLDLNAILTELEPMLGRLAGDQVTLTLRLAPTLPSILADRNQFEQVIVDLVANARDAMPSGGTLTLETRFCSPVDTSAWAPEQVPPGDYVELTLQDTGSGIDAQTLEHIFEPFFTTKDVGKGTGLGLSTVQGIVLQSGGFIRAASQPGTGTSFHVLFPVRAGDSPSLHSTSASLSAPAKTILLLEEQDDVRRFMATILADSGHRILETRDSTGALGILASVPVDLLVTSVILPSPRASEFLSGIELVRRDRLTSPGLPVVFVSGYSEDEAGRSWSSVPNASFLSKPFRPDALLEMVRAALAHK